MLSLLSQVQNYKVGKRLNMSTRNISCKKMQLDIKSENKTNLWGKSCSKITKVAIRSGSVSVS